MKKLLWIVAVVIILVFGFLGESYLLQDNAPANHAGKIFGKTISIEEFQRARLHTQIQAMIQYGQNYDRIRNFLNIDAETWDRLIMQYEARKRRIRVSDQEVVATIQAYPFFQRDGQFDNVLYKDVLQFGFRIKARDFEEGVRNSIKFARIFEKETAAITIPESEAFAAYKKKNAKVQISYVLIVPDDYKDQVAFDEAKAREYYANQKEEFRSPPMINVEYLRFDFPQPETAEEESLVPSPSDEEKDDAQEKAWSIFDELVTNPDFGAMAEKHNLPLETSGFFALEGPVTNFRWPYTVIQQIAQLDVGQFTEPVETPQGYQLLKLKERKDAYVPKYDEVRDNVKEAWLIHEAKRLTEKKASEYREVIVNEYQSLRRPDFVKIAKEHGLTLSQTPPFTQGQYLPKIGISKEFQDAAFALDEKNRISTVVATERGHAILHLDETIPVEREDFEKHKDEFAAALLTEKRNEAFNDFVTRLRLKADLEDNIAKLVAEQNPTP